MDIEGKQITFDSRPKHGAVMAARSIETSVIEQYVDITTIDMNGDMQSFVKQAMAENPELKTVMMNLQASKHIDQTILLAVRVDGKIINYRELQQLKDEMYEDEYITMFEKSKEALGNKEAKDFFAIYRGGIDSQLMAKIMSRNKTLEK